MLRVGANLEWDCAAHSARLESRRKAGMEVLMEHGAVCEHVMWIRWTAGRG